MKTAILKTTPGDKLRFEVHSTPSRGHHSGVQKWYMKANHPVEASRWIQTISKGIEWYKRDVDGDRRWYSTESESGGLKPVESRRRGLSSTLLRRKSMKSETSISSNAEMGPEGESGSVKSKLRDSIASGYEKETNSEEEEEENDSSDADSITQIPPHDSAFDLHGNSIIAQMEITSQLLANLSSPSGSHPQAAEFNTALQDSFALVQGMFNEYVRMATQRDEWWKSKLQREKLSQSIWQDSFASVVREGEALEQELRKQARRRGKGFADEGKGTIKQISITSSPVASSIPEEFMSPALQTPRVSTGPLTAALDTPTPTVKRRSSMSIPLARDQDNESNDTDEEDEFFDAIETGTLPNLVIPKSFEPNQSELTLPDKIDAGLYAGYANFRTRLNISADNRPSTSLWSVLKHSIGKDLTKISFPVFFNEPTSMLQRMVCLSLASFLVARLTTCVVM
jgi:hypothetical protein